MFRSIFEPIFQGGYARLANILCLLVGLLVSTLFLLWYTKKIKISTWRVIAINTALFFLGYLLMQFLKWLETGEWGGINNVRGFIYLTLFILPLAKLLRLDIKKAFDALAPAIMVTHAVGHTGCFFAGCCYGYPAEHGIYNPMTNTVLFPITFIEMLATFVVIALLVLRCKHKKYECDGLAYPWMCVAFGISRFFIEYGRDNEKLWNGISSLAFHALFMALVGAVWLCVVAYRKKLVEIQEKKSAKRARLHSRKKRKKHR